MFAYVFVGKRNGSWCFGRAPVTVHMGHEK